MSHENSITVKIGGKWRNVRTVAEDGRQLSEQQAVERARKGVGLLGQPFDTMQAAVNAAKLRSNPPLPKRKPSLPRKR